MEATQPRTVIEALTTLRDAEQHQRAAEVAAAVAIARSAELYRVGEMEVFDGMERMLNPGNDGTPSVGEFLAAEISAVLGISPDAGLCRIAEVLNGRFRFPQMWQTFLDGKLRWWQVVNVAGRAAVLSMTSTVALDRQLAWALTTMPWQRVVKNLDRWIINADPAAHTARLEAAAEDRHVCVTSVVDGHCQVRAQLDAADGVVLDHTLDRIADNLPVECGTKRQRRAAALGVLARQAFGQDVLPQVTLVVHINAADPALSCAYQAVGHRPPLGSRADRVSAPWPRVTPVRWLVVGVIPAAGSWSRSPGLAPLLWLTRRVHPVSSLLTMVSWFMIWRLLVLPRSRIGERSWRPRCPDSWRGRR